MNRYTDNLSRLEVTAELAKYSRAQIPPELLDTTTSREYFESRIWRAKNLFGLLTRILFKWYYTLIEHPLLRMSAKPFLDEEIK